MEKFLSRGTQGTSEWSESGEKGDLGGCLTYNVYLQDNLKIKGETLFLHC